MALHLHYCNRVTSFSRVTPPAYFPLPGPRALPSLVGSPLNPRCRSLILQCSLVRLQSSLAHSLMAWLSLLARWTPSSFTWHPSMLTLGSLGGSSSSLLRCARSPGFGLERLPIRFVAASSLTLLPGSQSLGPHSSASLSLRYYSHSDSNLLRSLNFFCCSLLSTYLEGYTAWMQYGCKVFMYSYMASNGSCFMVTWTIFFNHLWEVGLTQIRETMALWTLSTAGLF